MHNVKETVRKKVTLGDLVRQNDMDPDTEGNQNDREPSVNWISETPHTTSLDDPNSYSHLPPVLEEPSSSFSEDQNYFSSVLFMRCFNYAAVGNL